MSAADEARAEAERAAEALPPEARSGLTPFKVGLHDGYIAGASRKPEAASVPTPIQDRIEASRPRKPEAAPSDTDRGALVKVIRMPTKWRGDRSIDYLLDEEDAAAVAVAVLAAGFSRTSQPVQVEVTRHTSDGYHTFDELYDYRMLYNAHAAQGWLAAGVPVVKSWRHSDGELAFGGGWFVVSAELSTGQVTNHYKTEYWDLFDVPEAEQAPTWDGHTPQVAADRLRAALGGGEQ